ncbi:MAG: hypothetical protein KKF52_02565 [Nanoarchaeota archaeon]|nr:hypothetical protein [Nanoarchaeota archaeon]MBU4351511.1 hypothetical protein [Nanoarchaeota archaeon]
MKKSYIYGKTFIKRILNHERDFTGIVLQPLFDFNEDKNLFMKLSTYFKQFSNTFQETPLILNEAIMKGIKMSNLEIPYLQAENLDISESWLRKVNLPNSNMPILHAWDTRIDFCDFTESIQIGANYCDAKVNNTIYKKANLNQIVCDPNTVFDSCIFTDGYMRGVNLAHVGFYRSILQRLDVNKTDFYFTNLEKADIRGLRNIKSSRNLHKAFLDGARMGSNEYVEIKRLKDLEDLDLPLVVGKLIPELDLEMESLVQRLGEDHEPVTFPKKPTSSTYLDDNFSFDEFIFRVAKIPNLESEVDLDEELRRDIELNF